MSSEKQTTELFDVIATNIKTRARRTMAAQLTLDAAQAFMKMAIMRRGVDSEFFSVVSEHVCPVCGAKKGEDQP